MKNLDWGKLSFGYSKTDYNVRCYYKDGKWSAPEAVSYTHLKNVSIIFSFYSDFGFYTGRPVRLDRSVKAFLH